jgi:hypothetical protein
MVEAIDDQSFFFGRVTHKTKALEVIVNLGVNKVVFNAFHPSKTLSSLGYFDLFYIIDESIVIQRFFIWKHQNTRLENAKAST